MSLNDTSVGIGDTKGTDITTGLQNPTTSSTYGDRSKDNNLLGPDAGGDNGEYTIGATKIEPLGTDPGQAMGSDTGSSTTSTTATDSAADSAQGIVEQVTDAAKSALNSVTGSK